MPWMYLAQLEQESVFIILEVLLLLYYRLCRRCRRRRRRCWCCCCFNFNIMCDAGTQLAKKGMHP